MSARPSLVRSGVALVSLGLFLTTAWAVVRAIWLSRQYGSSSLDDEGYVMVSLASFVHGHALYDATFSQYGPFYYLLFGLPLRWTGVELTHDLVRAGTAIEGIAIALLLAIAVWRSTRSLLAASIALVLVRPALYGLSAEPAHPHGLCLILTAAVIALGAREPRKLGRYAWFGVGACLAALALTKINVGVMTGAGVALALLAWHAASGQRAWWWWLGAALLVLLPVLWLRPELHEAPFRAYALLVSASVASIVIAAAGVAPRRELGSVAATASAEGIGLVGIVCVFLLFVTGTSIGGAWQGIVGQHFKFVESASTPVLKASTVGVAWSALAAAGVWAATLRWRPHLADRFGPWLAFVWGALALRWLLTLNVTALVSWSAPFAWTALACPPNTWSGERSARRPWTLVSIAAFQLLQGFPIWGTQSLWMVLCLAPLCAIALQQSVQYACAWIVRVAELPRVGTAAWIAAALVAALQIRATADEHVERARSPLPWLSALELHGAQDVRLTERDAVVPQWITAMLHDGASFYSYPAVNSLYFWSQTAPPTTLNITFRMDLLDREQEARVAQDLERQPDLLVLYTDWGASSVATDADPERHPLCWFLREQCGFVAKWWRFVIHARRGSSFPLRSCALVDGDALVLRLATPSASAPGSTSEFGAVSAFELADLGSETSFGSATGAPDSAFALASCSGAPIALPVADLASIDGGCVRISPRSPEVLAQIAAAVAPVVRVRAVSGAVHTYPIVHVAP